MKCELGVISGCVALLIAGIIASCQPGLTERDVRDLEREVMEIHDAVMPRMTELSRLRVNLLERIDSDSIDATILKEMQGSILALEEADSLMWQWMHAYNRPDYDEASLDDVREYLESEKQRIQVVSDKMTSSIERADSLMQTLK